MKVTLTTRFVAVLMLVVHLQANTVTWAAVENSSRLCLVGLRKGLLCCAQSCGVCSSHASRGCSKLPGGAQQCCHRAIRRSGRICSKASDVGCSIDATALHALVQPPRLKSLEPFEAGICATSDEIATKACYQLVEPQRVWGQCSYGVPCDPPCKHGVCFFGRCFCPPGSAASRSGCSGGLHLGACSNNSDVSADRECLVNIEYGAAVIPPARWQVAQGAEGRLWSKKRQGSGGGDRAQMHVAQFGDYATLPAGSLGRVAEVGSGQWTQTFYLLEARRDITADHITLIDPGIKGYLSSGNAIYKYGHLRGIPVKLLSMGAGAGAALLPWRVRHGHHDQCG